MKTPRLDRRLVLEEARRSPDGAGGFSSRWVALGTLWAGIRHGGAGREAARDHLTLSSVVLRITVRAAPVGAASRPRPDQRFREGGRIFHILSVVEADPHGRYLLCHAREEAAA